MCKGLMVSHDVRLSGSHGFTKLLYYIVCQPWENTKFIPKFAVTLTYKWDPKVIIYSPWIGSLMEVGSNRYSQQRHHYISWTLRHCVPLGDPKEVCSRKLWLVVS